MGSRLDPGAESPVPMTKLLGLSPWPRWGVEQSPFGGWPWFEGSFFTL